MSQSVDELLRQRMAAAVTRELHTHPMMRPLLKGGLTVDYTPRRIWGVATVDELTFSAEVESPSWWEAGLQTMEDRARALATCLAQQLREEWNQWRDGE